MNKHAPTIIALFFALNLVASNDLVRAPLEQSRPSYSHQRDSNLDRLTDRQWQEQQKSYDTMRRKSEQEILQRNKSGQQPLAPVKK